MLKTVHTVSLIAIMLWLAGCSRYPLGMDEKTWQALPTEKQLELLKLQAQQEHEESLARLQTEAEEARSRIAIEQERLQTLQRLYSHLTYGQLVQISFLRGEGYFYRYHPIIPDSVLLSVGIPKKLVLRSREDETLILWMLYLPGKVLFCSTPLQNEQDFNPRSCTVKVDRAWSQGQDLTLTVAQEWNNKRPLLKNTHIFIKYPPVHNRRHCDNQERGAQSVSNASIDNRLYTHQCHSQHRIAAD